MLQAARSRIRGIGGQLNCAGTRVLFELMQEEDELMQAMDFKDDTFETLTSHKIDRTKTPITFLTLLWPSLEMRYKILRVLERVDYSYYTAKARH